MEASCSSRTMLLLVPVLQILGYYVHSLHPERISPPIMVVSMFLCQHPVTPRPISRLVTSHQAAPLSSPRKCEMRAPAPRHRYGGGGGAGRGRACLHKYHYTERNGAWCAGAGHPGPGSSPRQTFTFSLHFIHLLCPTAQFVTWTRPLDSKDNFN